MKILPRFKASKLFLNEVKPPCLVAKVRNSELPGVATCYIEKFKHDPWCEIFLRGMDSKKISGWQHQFLVQLLEAEGLAAAIEKGMERYRNSENALPCIAARQRDQIRRRGIAPFVIVLKIVIDAASRKVILRVNSACETQLLDCDCCIYLRNGGWRFDLLDYYQNYASRLRGSRRFTLAEKIKLRNAIWREGAAKWQPYKAYLK